MHIALVTYQFLCNAFPLWVKYCILNGRATLQSGDTRYELYVKYQLISASCIMLQATAKFIVITHAAQSSQHV